MKLNIVPASTGVTWARAGIRTFFRQPLAFTGLFFMFMAALSVVAIVPVVGGLLALVLVPAATVGFMAATEQAAAGRFPMPTILAVGFRRGPRATRALLLLGALYAAAIALVVGISALIDGGRFAQLYAGGEGISREMVMDAEFRTAMWVATLLYLPVSLLFWHAPALVHWYAVPPVKSLFFSAVAVLKNSRAFLLYGATWMLVSFAAGLLLLLLTLATGSPTIAQVGLVPAALVMAAMFFASIWFSFRDSFSPDEQDAAALPPDPGDAALPGA